MPISRINTMRSFTATTLATASLLLAATRAQDEPRVLWLDDFEQGSLSMDAWSYDIGTGDWGWGNNELQSFTQDSSNIYVQDNMLHIVARRNEDNSGFTSARIKTENKVLFQYGTVEARIKWADNGNGGGLWPAFWTMGYNFGQVGWPQCGELDIMEGGQGTGVDLGLGNQRVVAGAHWEFEDTYATYATHWDAPDNLSSDFHVYALDWTPYKVTTYVDGVQTWEMNIDSSVCIDCEEFHQPHFMILSMAVGGGFTSTSSSSSSAGSSSSTGCSSSSAGSSSAGSSGGCSTFRTVDDIFAPLPADMMVDYVRILDNGYTLLAGPPVSPIGAGTQPPNVSPAMEMPDPVVTPMPTPNPTMAPTTPAPAPPTYMPTELDTFPPTLHPSAKLEAVGSVTVSTLEPTVLPTCSPSLETKEPVKQLEDNEERDDTIYVPAVSNFVAPTSLPTSLPTVSPISTPTYQPTLFDTDSPTAMPTQEPQSIVQFVDPMPLPTMRPTMKFVPLPAVQNSLPDASSTIFVNDDSSSGKARGKSGSKGKAMGKSGSKGKGMGGKSGSKGKAMGKSKKGSSKNGSSSSYRVSENRDTVYQSTAFSSVPSASYVVTIVIACVWTMLA